MMLARFACVGFAALVPKCAIHDDGNTGEKGRRGPASDNNTLWDVMDVNVEPTHRHRLPTIHKLGDNCTATQDNSSTLER